jgi:hypothetical protein
MVQVTRTDGTVDEIGGSMNDKLFARLAPSQHWVSYKILPDAPYVMTAKDKELKDYCDSHDRVVKAMSY